MRTPLPAVILLLAACSGGEEGASSAGGRPARVAVATAEAGSLSDTWTVPGDVRALDRAELASGAAGPVTELSVRVGDRVASGDTLLQIDPAPASARLAAARAAARETEVALAQARRDLERIDRVSDKVLSEAERDAARSRVDTLDARLQSQQAAAREAQVQLARHSLRAPFDGVVSARRVDRGDWVSIGQPVLDLVSVDAIDVRVDVTRALARQVQPGDPVTLGPVAGQVLAVVPALDPTTRTSAIRVAPAPGMAHDFVPGDTVSVGFRVQRSRDDGALVPRDALLLGPVDTRIARVAEGHADIVTVQVVATTAERALVTGIEPGDAVVTRGGERLRPGQALEIVEGVTK